MLKLRKFDSIGLRIREKEGILRTGVFLKALIDHDRDTFDHCVRVAFYLARLSEKLKLSPSERKILVTAGQLHDIGKLVVKPEILQSRENLEPLERDEIEEHPKVGRIVAQLTLQEPLVGELIIAHHEPSYPRKIIRFPEIAQHLKQLLRLTDKFDALISVRSYKPALEPVRCKRILLEQGFEEGLIDFLIEINQGFAKR